MRNYHAETSQGPVVWTSETPYPRVLLAHGFMRRAEQLRGWRERIPGLGFLHLPGHSGAPQFGETTLAAWRQGLGEALGRFPEPPLILAESLGAAIAMALPSRALVAVEPPLSVHDLWPLHRTIASAQARGLAVDPALITFFEKSFDWALDSISVPTLVLAGLEPLLPPRPVFPEPSLLADDDFARYAAHPLVEAQRIAGGHALLDRNPDGVMAAARPFMLRHGYLPA